MRAPRPVIFAVLATFLFVAGCDSAAERAQRHYESGMQYLQAGDVDRALVEFRNVFKLDNQHREARIAYAQAERDRGNLREAYSQYLRLLEQYPADTVTLRALSQLAADNSQWDDARKYVALALQAAPDDPELTAIQIYSDYGTAIDANDAASILNAVRAAKEMRQSRPGDPRLTKVVIDDLIRSQSLDAALTELDAAIRLNPTERIFYAQRLSVYAALNQTDKIEAGLIEMAQVFADAPEMHEALLRWYLSRKEIDKAEALLRSAVKPDDANVQPEIELVRFLGQYRSADAAIAELDKAIAAGQSVAVFRSARAGFRFDNGDREGAIAEMEEIIKTESGTDDARKVKVALARMQEAVGNYVAARALVEEILADDSGEVEAVRLKANWLIFDDNVAEAVSLLRGAIDQNPRDAGLMTLLAQAYERDGNRELVGEMLSRAVEASGRAPTESLQYAQFLAANNDLIAAESVLIDSLRIAPGTPDLLIPLGQIYLQLKDWPRTETVAAELEALGQPQLAAAVAGLRAGILQGQQRGDEALTYLEQAASGEGAALEAKVALLRNHIANGRMVQAQAFAAKILADDPDNIDLQALNAGTLAAAGNAAAAEAAYGAIVQKDPARSQSWLNLYRIVKADPQRQEAAAQLLEQALAANPDSGDLLWAKAGQLEAAGDIEGSIAIYEQLYKKNSGNPIVANNLASLLSNFRTDPESLKRAEIIARRLRGSGIAPYQDTYGWIAYQNGKYQEAVEELEQAAVGLPEDPVVQYHLGMTYLKLDRKEDAAAKFTAILALVKPDDSRDFVIAAKTELEKLTSAGIVATSP